MKGAEYRVLDVTGRVIVEGKGNSNLLILGLDLAGIQPGIYIFEAFDSRRILHKRFIKQ
ncbi:MAG: T9SS type A sorting domain-containing protein [Algoriphagus sp.]|nr:T9SS type A sorting domain-containing protein [Algoriphagus sp.]